MECTLIIGYQGMIELALRSGKVGSLIAYAVREGDQFYFRYGLDPQCDHIPSSDSGRDSLPLTHTYAVASVGTSKLFEVLSREQIDARRKRSSSAKRGFSPWDTDYESMARKSAIRALYKYLPKSHEITTAIALDVAAETYKPQSHAYDPQLADMLHSKGLLDDTEDNIVDEGSENA
jgi:recombination protein RecT